MLYKVLIPSTKGVRRLVEYTDDFYSKNYIPRDTAMYESIYLYEQEHKEILDKTRSLAGITGIKTDRVVFDFDSKTEPQKALDDARTLVSRLQSVFGDSKSTIRCFFSGNKGYHIEVHFKDTFITRPEFEAIINKFAGDLDTFDPSVKDEQRLFRFPLSRHPETDLYKIPILLDIFTDATNTHATFADVASDPKQHEEYIKQAIVSFGVVELPDQFKAAIANPVKLDQKVEVVDEKPDMSLRPTFLTPAKYVLSLGFFDASERNHACQILAATYRFLNFTKDQAYLQIKNAVNQRNHRLGLDRLDDAGKEELWRTVIEFVYGNAWRGATYSDTTDPLLLKTIERYDLNDYYNLSNNSDIVTIRDMGDSFIRFADELDKSIIKTGVREIDENLLLTSSMMVGLLGAPSSGKTGFFTNVLKHQSTAGINSFFVSADMSSHLLYGSLMRHHCHMAFKNIVDTVKNVKYANWSQELKSAFEIVLDEYKHVGFLFRSGPTIEDIANGVDAYEQKTGLAVRCLGVDYLEKMQSKYSDPTASSGYNAARLADLTRNKNITSFLMLQTQKAAGDPSDELLSMRNIKGASVIEQDCRVVLTTWRPGFNPDVRGHNPEDKFASIAIVKNNMGTTGRFDLFVDPKSGLYRSLNDEEVPEFEQVKANAAERKQNKLRAKLGATLSPRVQQQPRQPGRFVTKSSVGASNNAIPAQETTTSPARKNLY